MALSDELGFMAHPRPFLPGNDLGRLADHLVRLAEAEGVEIFLVGLPQTLRGHEGAAARRARRFAELLGQRSKRPVELIDERFSTREAALRLREQGLRDRQARERIDSAAAAVLLQAWLERRRPSGE